MRFKTNSFLFSFLFSHSHTKQYNRTNTLSHIFVFHLLLSLSLSPTLTLTLAHTQSHFQHKAKVLLCFVGYSYISGLKIQRDPFSQQNIALLFGLFFLDDGKRVLMWKSRQRKTFSGLFSLKNFVSSSLVGQKSFHVCGVFPGHFNRPICFKILTLS